MQQNALRWNLWRDKHSRNDLTGSPLHSQITLRIEGEIPILQVLSSPMELTEATQNTPLQSRHVQ